MATLNVNRSVQDAFYRYKMPKLLTKVEGNGNGIKTVVTNIVEVAKSISRPPAYPTKFFGCELGAQVQMDEKSERYIVNGCHDQAKLQELLFGFIDKFVLCEGCGNPETSLKVTKRKTIDQTCVACGRHRAVPLIHKLTTYIINHPPSDVSDTTTKSSKVEKRGKDGSSIDMPQASVRANVAERASGAVSAPAAAEAGDDDEIEWSEDVSEAAVRERQSQLGGGVAALTINADLELSIEDRLLMFDKFVQKRLKQVPFPAKEVLQEAERLECKEKGVMALAPLLDDENVIAKIDTHKGLLVQFTHENSKGQKYLLGAIERIVEAHQAALLPKVVAILKRIYDHDIVDEETIISWGEKSSKKYVSKELNQKIRDTAAPFLKWLKEAEEESEEDDDEDEEEDGIVYDGAASGVAVTEKGSGGGAADLEADDDLDIDAI